MTNALFELLKLIDRGFMHHLGYQLPTPANIKNRYQWLHLYSPYSLLAHDVSDDPKFIYANYQARYCFKYNEEEIIGLPSRLSAANQEQQIRQKLLLTVKQTGFSKNYSGPRIDKYNEPFIIHDGTVWQFYNQNEELAGQAALFWPDDLHRPDWFYNK